MVEVADTLGEVYYLPPRSINECPTVTDKTPLPFGIISVPNDTDNK